LFRESFEPDDWEGDESFVNEIIMRLDLSDIDGLSIAEAEEFILEGKFPLNNGFYGKITKEGFDKLLEDSRIRKIYAEKNGVVTH